MELPPKLRINAWTGEGLAASDVSITTQEWALNEEPLKVPKYLAVPTAANPANWKDERVGWGLVLPERTGLSKEQLASGTDAPEPIQRLLRERGNAPLFRYIPGWANRFTHLRNYRAGKDLSIAFSPEGIAPAALPKYLLIYGTPSEIPWDFQYALNAGRRCVGRLALQGDALENYVSRLLDDWRDSAAQIDQAVAWAVDHGADDITHLMRNFIAAKIYKQWVQDDTLRDKALFFDGESPRATASDLIGALARRKPSLIVTTSHGQTGPLNDQETMKARLGLPIDQNYQALDPQQVLDKWEPDGAIWYAHACCAAGSASETLFAGLVDEGSGIDRVLKAVAGLGSLIAPLPHALLSAKKPLRAFIGHVEPTFDWSISHPSTGQPLTSNLQKALYDHIYSSKPVGLSFREFYAAMADLYAEHDHSRRAYRKGEDMLKVILYLELASRDIQSTVILGDPTAVLPLLP